MCYSLRWRVGGAGRDALRVTLLAGGAGRDALCATPFVRGVEGVEGAGGAGGARGVGRVRRAGGDAPCAR